MFVGRKAELKTLEETYSKPGFQMTVIYGRQRIGKSTLISEFIKDKPASYYVASQSSAFDNLSKWSEQVISDFMPELSGLQFADFDQFFKFIGNKHSDEKKIIALDEIPYIAETDESFLSVFQRSVDNILSSQNIYVIICGSAVSFMEREILSEKSPLFGRRTNQIYLKPFNYLDSALFVPHYSYEEKAIVYGVTNGVAKYLSLFDDNLSLDENLIRQFFNKTGYLYEEPTNLLIQEFRTINTYNSVISICASGTNRTNEIADKAHISTAALSYVLKNLIATNIISKVTALTDESNKKKILYEITDGMYLFWYRFVAYARAAIEIEKGANYYYNNVKPRLHEFMGSIFEQMGREYTLQLGLSGKLNAFISEVGKWWGTNQEHNTTDIDIVGIDRVSKKAVLGECKFKNEKIGKEIFDALMARRGLIDRHYTEVQYLFFSLAGYTDWMKDNTDPSMIKLITLSDMYLDALDS